MSSITKRPDGVWRARYRDEAGREHARHFPRKVDAQRWLDEVTAAVVTGAYVDPKTAKTTVGEWLDTWLEGYGTRRASSVRQAKVHAALIRATFSSRRLADVRPSEVKAWTAKLKADGYADSTVYAVHARLAQVYRDAVHDGIVPRSPCSRRTSPGMARQRPYVATTAQVWALHDAMPTHLRPAVLLGAFVGLRVAEACGLRTSDVDFARGIVTPAVQYPAEPLKTETSRNPVPIPRELANMLALDARPGAWLLADPLGAQVGPWQVQRAVREACVALAKRADDLAAEAEHLARSSRATLRERQEAKDKADEARARALPAGFRYHDCRHYFASVLIAAGADVKVVQARLRHASATTTLNTYAHLWPDTEEATRQAIGAAIAERVASVQNPADSLRTQGVAVNQMPRSERG